jgi:rare lipoprotein A
MQAGNIATFFPALLLLIFLGGCNTTAPRVVESRADKPAAPPSPSSRAGGYYQDDGPGLNPPPNLDAVPDAEPRPEPLHKYANRPYTVLGQTYVPATSLKPYKATGIASWYGRKFHGQKTSSGEPYDMYGMTVAHPTLPIPSYARVTNPKNNKSVVVRINDRGPFHSDRVIDLSYTAAYKLGIAQVGSGMVEVEAINPLNFAAKTTPPVKAETQTIATGPAPGLTELSSIQPDNLPMLNDAGGIYLQLGAFSSEQNAESFSAKIKQQMGSLGDALHVLVSGSLYRIHLGPYRTPAEAGEIAALVKRSLNIAPVQVVR